MFPFFEDIFSKYQKWKNKVDKGKTYGVLLINRSKAFDWLNLNAYGFTVLSGEIAEMKYATNHIILLHLFLLYFLQNSFDLRLIYLLTSFLRIKKKKSKMKWKFWGNINLHIFISFRNRNFHYCITWAKRRARSLVVSDLRSETKSSRF